MTVRVTRAHWKGTFVPAFHIFPFPNAAISQKVQHETPQHAAVVNAAERIQKIQEVLKTADVATERVTWVGLKDDLWYLSNMMENQPQIVSVPKIHQIQTNRIYFLFAVFFLLSLHSKWGTTPPKLTWVFSGIHNQFMAQLNLNSLSCTDFPWNFYHFYPFSSII